jgi:tRNA-2-methylthio-N6-dimethylallyladenosine synthase
VVAKLRDARPDISLSSDFIIGFPGETEADFEQTMQLIEDVQFDQSFSFIYSQRPGTPAAALPDDVPMEIKKARLMRLQTRINEMATQISKSMIGSEQVLLVDGPSRKNPNELTGKTPNHRSVTFSGEPGWVGQFVKVRITHSFVNSLRGEAIEQAIKEVA